MLDKPVASSEIAAFMGVKKPTALKRMAVIERLGFVECIKCFHRKNAQSFKWLLTDATLEKQRNGDYESYYRDVATKRIQASTIKPHNKTLTI